MLHFKKNRYHLSKYAYDYQTFVSFQRRKNIAQYSDSFVTTTQFVVTPQFVINFSNFNHSKNFNVLHFYLRYTINQGRELDSLLFSSNCPLLSLISCTEDTRSYTVFKFEKFITNCGECDNHRKSKKKKKKKKKGKSAQCVINIKICVLMSKLSSSVP